MSPDTATPLAEQLAAWQAAAGIGYLELRGPGIDLRLLQRHGRVEPAPPGYPSDTSEAAQAVTAPTVGCVRHAHPLRTTALAEPGQPVNAGQVMVLLEIGTLLLPVVAPHAGSVAQRCAADGQVVGYGTALVGLLPMPRAAHPSRTEASE